MTTFDTFLGTNSSITTVGGVAFRLAIEGIGVEIVTDLAMCRSASGGLNEGNTEIKPKRILGLQNRNFSFSSNLSLGSFDLDTAGNQFSITATPEVLDIFLRKPTAISRLRKEMSKDDIFAFLDSVEGFVLGQHLYINNECMLIESVVSADNSLLVSRSDILDADPTEKIFHSYNVKHHVVNIPPLVRKPFATNRPLVFAGRRVFLYAYSSGDSLQGNGTLIYKGIISSDIEYSSDDLQITFTTNNIFSLLDQKLFFLENDINIRGIYHPEGTPFAVHLVQLDGASSTITLNTPTAAQTKDPISIRMNGFWETKELFLADLNSRLVTQIAAKTWNVTDIRFLFREADGALTLRWRASTNHAVIGGIAAGVTDTSLPDSPRHYLVDPCERDTVNFPDAMAYLRRYNVPPRDSFVPNWIDDWVWKARTDTSDIDVSVTTVGEYYNYICSAPFPDALTSLLFGTDRGFTPGAGTYPGNRLYLTSFDSFSIPISLNNFYIKDATRPDLELYFKTENSDSDDLWIQGPYIVLSEPADATGQLSYVVVLKSPGTTLTPAINFNNLDTTATNTFANLVSNITSASQDYSTIGWPNIFPDDVDSYTNLNNILMSTTPPEIALYRSFIFPSTAVTVKDILLEELKLCGLAPTIKMEPSGSSNFYISAFPFTIPSLNSGLGSSWTDSQIIKPEYGGMRPGLTRNSYGLKNLISLKTGYSAKEEDWLGTEYKIKNVDIQSISSDERIFEITPYSIYSRTDSAAARDRRDILSETETRITTENIQQCLLRMAGVLGSPYFIINFSVPLKYLRRVSVGEVFRLPQAKLLPNLNTGAFGITEDDPLIGLIIGNEVQVGSDIENGGMINLSALIFLEGIPGYTPSAAITAVSSSGTGYFAITTATSTYTPFPETIPDCDWFNTGDKVLIWQWDTSTPATSSCTVVSVSPSTYTLFVTASDIGKSDAYGSGSIVSFENWDNLNTSANRSAQRGWSFMSSGSYSDTDNTTSPIIFAGSSKYGP